jgi:hypothetical protein
MDEPESEGRDLGPWPLHNFAGIFSWLYTVYITCILAERLGYTEIKVSLNIWTIAKSFTN